MVYMGMARGFSETMKQTAFQFLRYGIVGLVSNAIGFILYILLTTVGIRPKLAMSLLYIVGTLQTFLFNKKWTFSYNGKLRSTFGRYFSIYAAGYLINLSVLILFVDRLGYQHQWVQGIMILVLAVFLFVMQKLWVFRHVLAPGSRLS